MVWHAHGTVMVIVVSHGVELVVLKNTFMCSERCYVGSSHELLLQVSTGNDEKCNPLIIAMDVPSLITCLSSLYLNRPF